MESETKAADVPSLIEEIVERVKRVDGVHAVVLGGSRARGTETPTSDVDLGIYYDPDDGIDLESLGRVATELDDEHRPQVLTALGGWGPWINGGGWLTIRGRAIDFLYRDLQRVAAVVGACSAGTVEIVYQSGHPHGFVSSIYTAEVALCRVLWERDGRVSGLKAATQPYPAALQRALVQKFEWEIDFALRTARKGVPRRDVVYVAGSCFRSAACMLQVVFALNRQYWMNEKGAVALAETFPLRPRDFASRLESAFTRLAPDPVAIGSAVETLAELAEDVRALVIEARL